MAARSSWLMIVLVIMCKLSSGIISAQGNERAIPGYSLEEISRNFRESVAKAVEQRLHKGTVGAETQTVRTVVPKVAPSPKAVPAVIQPAPMIRTAPVHITPAAPPPQLRRVMQVVEEHPQYFMDIRNGQVFLEQTHQVPSVGQYLQRNVQIPTGQVFVNPNVRTPEVFPVSNHHHIPQAVPGRPEYMTKQVFGERRHYENQIPVQIVQEPVVIQTVKAATRNSAPSVNTNFQQEFVQPQIFESVREEPKVVPKVSQAPRSQSAPVVRQRVQNKAQVKQNNVVSERFGVPVVNETDDEDFYKQAQDAHYSFSSAVQDGINDNHHTREEQRDGLSLRGRYSYSDGFFKRTVHYEADEKGYRVTKQEVQPLGDGPRINPEGVAEVNTSLGGSYSITAQEIKDVREAEKEGQKLV